MMDGKKCSPAMKAKMEVIEAIRKMAMELMGTEEGTEDGAVVAELEMKKLPGAEMDEGELQADVEMDDGTDPVTLADEEEDDSDDDASFLDKMIKKKKMMA